MSEERPQASVLYTQPAPGVVRILLNRPAIGNAQNTEMTYDLNDALTRAAHDDEVAVIILAGQGKHFSTGHDLKDQAHDSVVQSRPHMSAYGHIDTSTVEGFYCWEREVYLEACKRWRDIPKPMIAEVSGACMGGGLMLAWVCDLIIASDDAFFSDPVVNFGVNGVEFFVHAWEIGARKAKEMLFMADSWTAQQALDWGMVNHVIPRADLEAFTLTMAKKIATKPMFALMTAKQSVNASLDSQGQGDALEKAFLLHQLCHAHNRVEFGGVLDPRGLPQSIRNAPPGTLSALIVGTKT